jgi:hypothetical protein
VPVLKTLLLAALLLALPPGLARASEAIVVIAHAEFAELEEVSIPMLRQLFLARRSTVGGRRVSCFEPAPATPLRRAFARLVLASPERELERYWLEQALSGGPPPPREIGSEAELVRRVALRAGAIGYLGWSSFSRLPREGIKVVPLRDGSRLLGPEDHDYPLRFDAPRAR